MVSSGELGGMGILSIGKDEEMILRGRERKREREKKRDCVSVCEFNIGHYPYRHYFEVLLWHVSFAL